MDVLFVSDDLLFASRVQAAVASVGRTSLIAAATWRPTAPDDACRLAIVDLSALRESPAAIIANVKSHCPQARIIAFGPHVDEVTLSAARDAGCDDVWTRGQFHKQYLELVRDVFPSA